MASALIEELKTVATEAKRSQIEDAVGSSWTVLAAEGPSRERDRNSTDQSGSRRRGLGEGMGAGLLNSENNGRICSQPSLIEKLS